MPGLSSPEPTFYANLKSAQNTKFFKMRAFKPEWVCFYVTPEPRGNKLTPHPPPTPSHWEKATRAVSGLPRGLHPDRCC